MTIAKTAAGIGGLVLALALTGAAEARQDPPRRHHDGMFHHGGPGPDLGGRRLGAMFDLLDIDGDDKVSLDEGLRVQRREFARRDLDGDGFLSRAEIAPEAEPRAERFLARWFDRIDADNDLKLSPQEFEARARTRFDVADADNDGVVTRAEFDETASLARRAAHRFARRFGKDRERGERHEQRPAE